MRELIKNRLGCSEKEAEQITNDLQSISSELKEALNRWIDNEEIDDTVVIQEYTIRKLMADYDMSFTGALLTIDWLLKDPEEAKKALAYGIR